MLIFKLIIFAITFEAAMAERFYNVVTTTTTPLFVDNYQESATTSLFMFKQQSVSTKGFCAILCTKETSQPCGGFTVTSEQDTGRFICNLGKG